MSDRQPFFDEYFDSSYKNGNILTPAQFDLAAEYFARDYAGLIPQNRDAAILDVGCGVGHFLYYLEKAGYKNFFGIDVSGQQIDYCRQYVSQRAAVADALKFLSDKQDYYNCITAHDVLEHLTKSDGLHLLKLIFVSLKEEGCVIIRVPNMSNPFGLDARYNDLTHETGYTSKSLRQALYLAGFRDIRVLPERTIPVKSLRNWVRKILLRVLQLVIRFCYYIQDYTVPENLDKNLVMIARKDHGSKANE